VSRRRLRLREIPRKLFELYLPAARCGGFVCVRSPHGAPPYWKGYLKLFPRLLSDLALFGDVVGREDHLPARLTRKTGNRLRQQTGRRGHRREGRGRRQGQGHEVDKGVYLRIEDEEIEANRDREQSTRSRSTGSCRKPRSTSATSTALLPHPERQGRLWTLLPLIRDAMHDKSMVALAGLVLSSASAF